MSLTDNQLKAYACAQHKLGHATEVTAKAMVTDPQGELETSLSYIDQTPMVETYMRQLTAAIVWAVIGEFDSGMHWDEAVVWSPQYVSAAGPLSVHEAGLQLKSQKFLQARIDQHTPYWWPGWSSYPKGYPSDIYRFEVSLAPSQYVLSEERSRQVWLRHWFFGQFPWYVWFIASERTKDTIADAIRAISG